jgi:tRNA (mo5U34)-methyltransferase
VRWGRRRRLRKAVRSHPFWWHSIELGDGVVTPGTKSLELLRTELELMQLPPLEGRSVLDVGGWDGFFAFEAERRGAIRVAVLDHYFWSMELGAMTAYYRRCREEGVSPRPYHEMPFWHPDEMPGKRGFDVAREALGSRVQAIPVDFMAVDLAQVGEWDVTFFLGVLYHMEDPLRALRRLATVTRELAVIETEAVVVPGYEHEALWRFFPGAELNNDISSWWAPNMPALAGAIVAAGFSQVDVKVGPPPELLDLGKSGTTPHFRAVVHALKRPPAERAREDSNLRPAD